MGRVTRKAVRDGRWNQQRWRPALGHDAAKEMSIVRARTARGSDPRGSAVRVPQPCEVRREARTASAERRCDVTKSVIQPLPPQDDNEWDCQCARCGSSCDSQGCDECRNDGFVLDDHWGIDGEDIGSDCRTCPTCRGRPVSYHCLSHPAWCDANPLQGREHVKRGKIEWFVVREGGDS